MTFVAKNCLQECDLYAQLVTCLEGNLQYKLESLRRCCWLKLWKALESLKSRTIIGSARTASDPICDQVHRLQAADSTAEVVRAEVSRWSGLFARRLGDLLCFRLQVVKFHGTCSIPLVLKFLKSVVGQSAVLSCELHDFHR